MSTQVPVGTIPYMAPEQIQAHARPASDHQYALGVAVYEWLCGVRPFEGSYTEIFSKPRKEPDEICVAVEIDALERGKIEDCPSESSWYYLA